jgi:hypothetical protein
VQQLPRGDLKKELTLFIFTGTSGSLFQKATTVHVGSIDAKDHCRWGGDSVYSGRNMQTFGGTCCLHVQSIRKVGT